MLPTCINAKQSEHLESHAALMRWCDCAPVIARDEPLREKEAHIKIAFESSSLLLAAINVGSLTQQHHGNSFRSGLYQSAHVHI